MVRQEQPGVRSWLLLMPELTATLPYTKDGRFKKLYDYMILLPYGHLHHSRTKRTPMNVDEQVDRWIQIITGLAMAHTKADADAADYELDEIMEPILAAPIAQLREFYPKLIEAMKADERVPYLIWRTFEMWRDNILDKAPDEAAMKLRDDLATYIAGAVEKDVQPDIMDAMVDALKWRPAEDLEAVKRELDEGVKPRIRGRESCLFLEVGDAKVML